MHGNALCYLYLYSYTSVVLKIIQLATYIRSNESTSLNVQQQLSTCLHCLYLYCLKAAIIQLYV